MPMKHGHLLLEHHQTGGDAFPLLSEADKPGNRFDVDVLVNKRALDGCCSVTMGPVDDIG